MAERFNLERIKHAVGSQPNFHDTPAIDALSGMVIALLGEVAVLRDRIDASERLSRLAGGHGPEDVDRFRPTAEDSLARQGVRNAIYDRVLGVAVERLVPETLKREQTAYEQVIQDVATR
jgi:hypothetical protein